MSLISESQHELMFNKKVEKLRAMNIANHQFMVNSRLGYYPYFSIMLRKRIKQKKVINAIYTGEGGIGKSYGAMDLCRTISSKFGAEDIVFTYVEFMRAFITTSRGTPIVFDEPSYAMSKKDWYKELTKALVKTIESFRFKGKPLFIPIINKALLEKDIRSYLIQFHIVGHDRGYASAYRIFPSQFSQKTYNYEICKLRYGLFDNNLCDKDSCLTCRKLMPKDKSQRCMIFRAMYERKKATTQEERYEKALEDAEDSEYSKLTLEEVEAKAVKYFDKFFDVDKGKIDIDMLHVVLLKEEKIRIGHNKLYKLRRLIEYDHSNLFPEPTPINKDNVEKVTKNAAIGEPDEVQ